jgi:hypothetical protein
MLTRSRIVQTAATIVAVASHLPTAAVIAFLLVLLLSDISKAAQEITATFVALFGKDPERADRALQVIHALRGPSAVRRRPRGLG